MTLPVFDGHNDMLTCADHAGFVGGRPDGHVDLPRMRAGGMRGGLFAVFCHSPRVRVRPLPRADGVREFEMPPALPHRSAAAFAADAAGRLFALEREGALVVGRGVEDLDRAVSGSGPPVAVLHLEGAEPIDQGLESLDLWYAAGLRSLGPVWSRHNRFGHGVPFIYPSSPDTGPGLTDAGVRLARRCAELGVMVDLAHLNEAGFWDAARLDLGPLVVSHGCVHALSAASRNLTDSQIDAIGASGGLIGIAYAIYFLRSDFGEDPTTTPVSLIAQHARYVADRIGVDGVALGSDFDGTTIPSELGDVSGLPRVLEALRDVGFSQAEIEAIAWGNWRRVLGDWWR
jgi:membrane dipeptidase